MAEQNPIDKAAGLAHGALTTALNSAEVGLDAALEAAKLAKVVGVGAARGAVNVGEDTLDSLIKNLEDLKAQVAEQAHVVADTLTGQGS